MTAGMVARPTIIWARSRVDVFAVATLPATRPWRSTVMRLVMLITSWSLWLMKMTARPRCCSRRSPSKSWSTSWGTSTAVGSSRMSTLASR
ncbi:MAG: hypothetical protein R3A10_09045 [Caldilineaceae bacterium]